MYSKIYSCTITGIEGALVEIEVQLGRGLPDIKIVGMAGKAVREAKVRVISALKSSGVKLLPQKIRINLAPADLPKNGAALDLPIAIAILCASNSLNLREKNIYAYGELGLDGEIRSSSRGILQFLECVQELGDKKATVLIPPSQKSICNYFERLNILTPSKLEEVVRFIRDSNKPVYKTIPDTQVEAGKKPPLSLDTIVGQHRAKRALQIAVAGRHHLLLSGPPGIGKSLLARAAITLFPEPDPQERYQILKVDSATGRKHSSSRPLREVSFTTTSAGLLGNNRRVGEIMHAHMGILLIDELSQMSKDALTALKICLEDQVLRPNSADFVMIATTNPCSCGYFGARERKCTCSAADLSRFSRKLTPPLLSRIDLFAAMYSSVDTLKKENNPPYLTFTSRVYEAVEMQKHRYKGSLNKYNRDLSVSDLKNYAGLSHEATEILSKAERKFGLSSREVVKALRVARTIADLEAEEVVSEDHTLEALSFRHIPNQQT